MDREFREDKADDKGKKKKKLLFEKECNFVQDLK